MLNRIMKEMMILNRKAFIACKSLIIECQQKVYESKCEIAMRNFEKSIEKRKDVNCQATPLLNFEDYPTPACLNRYLRENFGDRYPRYIEAKQKDYVLILKLVDITEDEGHSIPGMVSFNNGLGKIYNYREYVLEH